jgi:hypothetical protein
MNLIIGRYNPGFKIHPPVLEPTIHRVDAIHKLPLDPLDITEPWAVGELIQHPGRNQIRNPSPSCLTSPLIISPSLLERVFPDR